MVIIVIDSICVAVNKFKKYWPITRYSYGVKAFFVAAQLMEKRTRVIHILYFTCGIKSIKNSFKPIGMFRLYSFIASCVKEILQVLMFKGFYHSQHNVTQTVTFVNPKLSANGEDNQRA